MKTRAQELISSDFSPAALVLSLLLWQPAVLGQLPQTDSDAPANPLRSSAAGEKLPWERQPPSKHSPPLLRPIADAREFLARYGIVASQWDGFLDGQSLSAAEEEVVIRLLQIHPRFGQENVERWAVRDLTADQLAGSATEHRGKIVHLSGRVQRAVRVPLLPELAGRFDFADYYRVNMQLDGGAQQAIVYCREIPGAWPLDKDISEQAAVYGLFLKVGDESQPSPLLLVTYRIAWLPAAPRPELSVTPAHVALAGLGVDIGRFQLVGKERRIGLSAADREPFYQILATLADEPAAGLLSSPAPGLDLARLLKEPQKVQGHVLPVRGLARRVARVEVPDVDIRQRFGIDHYYEVDLSLPLRQTIRLGSDPANKADAVVYENSFPATICVRELPAGLTVGDGLRQPVEASAVFFKVWLYQSTYTDRARLAQPAPLFLARQVQVVAEQETPRWWSDVIVGAAMAVALLTFVGILLWFRWSDRAHDKRKPADETPQPQPDFSDLR